MQIPHTVLYQGTEYSLSGYTGFELPEAEYFDMSFDGRSTGCRRGHTITYKIDEDSQFLAYCVNVDGAEREPKGHDYQMIVSDNSFYRGHYIVNAVLENVTGYILFKDLGPCMSHVLPMPDGGGFIPYHLHEAYINHGHVEWVHDITGETKERTRDLNFETFWKGMSSIEEPPFHDLWDYVTSFLPRRYDAVYYHEFIWHLRGWQEGYEKKSR